MRRLAPLERPNEVRGGVGGAGRGSGGGGEGGARKEGRPGPVQAGRALQLGPPVPHPPHTSRLLSPAAAAPLAGEGVRGAPLWRWGAPGGSLGEGEEAPSEAEAGKAGEGSAVLRSDQNKGKGGSGPSAGVRGGAAAAVRLRRGLRQLYFFIFFNIFLFRDIVRVGCVCSSARRAAQKRWWSLVTLFLVSG